jgi:hypothetical protein
MRCQADAMAQRCAVTASAFLPLLEPWKLWVKRPINCRLKSPRGIAVDLQPAIAMRHRLIHGYDSVSADIIAKTVRDDFPDFISSLRRILAAALPDES